MSRKADSGIPGGGRVCPASHGALLALSLRRLAHRPERILAGLVEPGWTVADLGCGPGFFTIPLARMVGATGRVIAVDVQDGMLDLLRSRAERAGVMERIRPHRCAPTDLALDERVDFALAFYVVHESPDVGAFLRQARGILKPGGRFLMVEPNLHVSQPAFARTVEMARDAGLRTIAKPKIALSRAALFAGSDT